jgi:aminoglycoside phosphotransferase family enzyme/predicted kinase
MSDSSGQQQLIDNLSQRLKQLYGQPVERIETHISTILLVAGKAYKIKKPVNFGFLDFSTLEQRRHYCNEELRLNSRLAPGLYQRVVAITGTPASPDIESDDRPIEYMIEMQRFAKDEEFKRLLADNRLQSKDIDELAEILAHFHQSIAPADDAADYVQVTAVAGACLENFAQINQHRDLLPPASQADFEQLQDWTSHQLEQLRPDMQQRLMQGFVRECHGDLHLGNITRFEGRITVFDGIEFNNAFRWIDVISDLAFLLMDLHYAGHSEFAWRLLNRYLEKNGDFKGLKLLRFYMVYRAMVRAKVAMLRLTQLPACTAEFAATEQSISQHIQLAVSLALQKSSFLMITHGLSGSGKSYRSAIALARFGAIRLRSDVERKRLLEQDGNLYSSESRNSVYDYLHTLAGELLDSGFNVIVDATYLAVGNRSAAAQLARSRQVKFQILDVPGDINELEQRLRRRAAKGGHVSDADVAVLHEQIRTQDVLNEAERQSVITV